MTQPKHIVIAGGNGSLGCYLAKALLERGDRVTVLCRPGRSGAAGTQTLTWDGKTADDWINALDEADVLVNLVGRSVDCRKTPENRAAIMNSRVDSVRLLGEACRQVDAPPPVWLQAGTAHIHGDPSPEDTLITDDSPIGQGLAPEVGLAWEAAFNEAKLPSQRGVISRTSFVLSTQGGAMDRLVWLVKRGLGGTVGHGRQYISWIHEDDMNAFWLRAMDDSAANGTYLVTAPDPQSNAVFMKTMREVWKMPWSPPAPKPLVQLGARFIMNTDPELALLGRRCVPDKLINELNFQFQYPTLKLAMQQVYTSRRPVQ